MHFMSLNKGQLTPTTAKTYKLAAKQCYSEKLQVP